MTPSVVKSERPLPAAYAIFLPVFEQLSMPLRRLLHGQLVQFERLLAEFDEAELRQQGNFEGLGSITTRGDIANIVQSELLLRSEAPLEFLRRIAESETLYMEREYSDPGMKPIYRLMISVGPGLLGHGRILALATIFFMARMASIRGAGFHWCFLPRAEGAVWFDSVSVNTIKRFLRAANYAEASLDDVIAADQCWESLTSKKVAAPTARHIDWVVGAIDRRSTQQSPRAVHNSGRAVTFALLPQVDASPRAAEITIRRGGRDVQQMLVEFPSDTVCLSALNQPFAPIKPIKQQADQPSKATQPVGWEPRYLLMPHAAARVVRLKHGVLILIFGGVSKVVGSYFLRVEPHTKIAGVSLRANNKLSVLLQTERSGRDMLVLTSVDLIPNMRPIEARHVQSHCATVQHLFKRQPEYALPPLFDVKGIRFYSTHHSEFALAFDTQNYDPVLQVLHNKDKILYSNGVHRVVRSQHKTGALLKIMRRNNTMVTSYVERGDPLVPKQLFGMVYSGSHGSLAYSVRPNVWTVADREADRTFVIAPHDTPLMARVMDGDLTATIWSDARSGGEGALKNITLNSDGMHSQSATPKSHRTLLKLGDDAADTAHVQLAEDGIWTVTIDRNGAPAELLWYSKRRDGPHRCSRFNLAELYAAAIDIDPGLLSHG